MLQPPKTKNEPLIAWPGIRNLRSTLALSLLFLLIFYAIYGGASLVTNLHSWRIPFFFAFELNIPFLPQFALVYLSLDLMLGLAPFILRTWSELLPLFLTLVVETVVAAVFFILLPLESGFTPQTVTGLTGYIFNFADLVNLSHNYLPSLHVAFAVTLAIAFSKRCEWLGRCLFMIWALVITTSTILIHEHHLLDILSGIALAVLMMGLVYERAGEPSFLDKVRIEVICLYEFSHFIRRRLRYLFIFIGIYRYSLGRWNCTRIIRAGYCLAQHVDDVLDGDRLIQTEPQAYVHRLIQQISQNSYDNETPLGVLAGYIMRESVKYEKKPGEFKENLLKLFNILLFDWQRRSEMLLLSASELAEHHRHTFYYSANLTLIMLQSDLRADDVPELISALSWCSPLRDLPEDLARGLINIPRPVVDQAREQGVLKLDYTSLTAAPAVRAWIQAEFKQGQYFIHASLDRLKTVQDKQGVVILQALTKALQRYADQYAQKNEVLEKSLTV